MIHDRWFAALSALLAAALTGMRLHDGVMTGPDGWAYWQGAVSMLHGNGYRTFFFEHPIEAWPPLYSLYLAAWQAVAGVSGQSLVFSCVAAAACTAWGWTRLGCEVLFREPRLPLAARVFLALACALYWSIAACGIASEVLRNALLPLFLLGVFRLTGGSSDIRVVARTGLAGGLLLLTHNSSIALLGAGMLVFICNSDLRVGRRLSLAAATTTLAIIPAAISRTLLHQWGSHPFALGNGQSSWIEVCRQCLASILTMIYGARMPLVVSSLTTVALLVWILRICRNQEPGGRTACQLLEFGILSSLGIVLIFANVWIANPLAPHYLPHAGFILILLALYAAALQRAARVAWIVGVITMTLLASRTLSGWRLQRTEHDNGYPLFIVPSFTLVPEYQSGPPVRRGNLILVAPPMYMWIEERLQALKTKQIPARLQKGHPAYRNIGW